LIFIVYCIAKDGAHAVGAFIAFAADRGRVETAGMPGMNGNSPI